MSLELHVWGPAFGLSSIDPDCLGIITYFSLAVPHDIWTLVPTSPSAVPRPLPALRDAHSGRWLASGFQDIVALLRRRGSFETSETPETGLVDLDAGLTPLQAADSTAYGAFLHAEAAPLLALSLYVSSANWSATTRPAYSHLLPFPLTWIEPPAVRAEHAAAAAHLGLSSLDTDADDEDSLAGSFSSLSAAALQVFPDRLRASRRREGSLSGGGAPPASPANPTLAAATAARTAVSSALTPEARAQIRLDDTARACLSVLAERRGTKRFFLRSDDRPSALDCLAFGYLALMTVPDVPRPFLSDTLQRHYGSSLAMFVTDMQQMAFGSEAAPLPWRQREPRKAVVSASSTSTYLAPLWLRTVHGTVHGIPGPSGQWLVWLYQLLGLDDRRAGGDGEDDSGASWRQYIAARGQRVATLCTTLAGAALAVGLILRYRSLPPFGSPVMIYQRIPRATFLGLGAAGTFLSSL